jgi:hypothetical protein
MARLKLAGSPRQLQRYWSTLMGGPDGPPIVFFDAIGNIPSFSLWSTSA